MSAPKAGDIIPVAYITKHALTAMRTVQAKLSGIEAALLVGCEVLALYVDRGVSLGMAGEQAMAIGLGIPFEERRLAAEVSP